MLEVHVTHFSKQPKIKEQELCCTRVKLLVELEIFLLRVLDLVVVVVVVVVVTGVKQSQPQLEVGLEFDNMIFSELKLKV